MNFIWGLITGVVLSTGMCLLWPKKKPAGFNNVDEAKKDQNLEKIEEFIADKDKFTNDELQNFLGVSDSTIGRYLEDLEHLGKITQVGDGPDTYYTKS